MNNTSTAQPEMPLHLLLLTNDLCNRLEAGWRNGDPPPLELLLVEVSEADRIAVLGCLIPLDMDYRRLAGQEPKRSDYQQRFPEVEAIVGVEDITEETHLGIVSVEEFLARLRNSGLISAAALAHEEAQPGSVQTRVARLVAAGLLTEFQANQLIRTDGKPLAYNDYLLVEPLGSGGMGTVYRAWHRRLNKVVALKMATGPTTPAQRSRFKREAQAAGRLTHPHIVATLDAGEAHGTPYLVMQWISGRDLGCVVREDGPVPMSLALDYIRQAAEGLQYAHDQGIIHRDVKPSNLIVDGDGTVRVLDLGLAHFIEPQGETETTSGTILGTRNYLAPEQFLAPSQVDGRADIYGLGCTLHTLLTGHPPDAPGLLRKFPPALADLVRRMHAPSPLDRPRSMSAVIEELRAIEQPPSSWGRVALVILLCVSLLTPLLVWTFWPPQEAEPTVDAYPLTDPSGYQQRWADHLGLPVQVCESDGMTFVFIPPARHEGTLVRPFYLATTETTSAQFRRFMVAQPPRFQTRAERDGGWGIVAGEWVLRPGFSWRDTGELLVREDHPAPNVTGEEAALFCRWRTTADHLYRLPTEREWEHACRAGSLELWCFGGDETRLGQFAWTRDKSGERPHPVGQLRPNAFGLYDTHGNHAEWCSPRERTETQWPTRGGGFLDVALNTTSSSRKVLRSIDLEAGFRVLREIPEDNHRKDD